MRVGSLKMGLGDFQAAFGFAGWVFSLKRNLDYLFMFETYPEFGHSEYRQAA